MRATSTSLLSPSLLSLSHPPPLPTSAAASANCNDDDDDDDDDKDKEEEEEGDDDAFACRAARAAPRIPPSATDLAITSLTSCLRGTVLHAHSQGFG